MTIRSTSRALLLVSLASAACTSSPSGRPSAPRSDPNVITQAQIQQHKFTNAYDAVEGLRPRWLEARGVDSFSRPSQVLVYFDNNRVGGVAELRAITPPSIAYIRYFNGTDATARWGLDHGAGVIFVSSRPDEIR
jgi:hypothetical protein